MSKDELMVPVGAGKYRFHSPDNDYRIHVTRYNEPWLVIESGHKAIYCMMFELDEARKRILELEKKLGPTSARLRPGPPPRKRKVGCSRHDIDSYIGCKGCDDTERENQRAAQIEYPGQEEAVEYLNEVAETIGVSTAPHGYNGAAVLMKIVECLNLIPPGYRDDGLVDGMRKMAEELQDWRSGAEAGFGVMTAKPRATLIALGDRMRELEDKNGLDEI